MSDLNNIQHSLGLTLSSSIWFFFIIYLVASYAIAFFTEKKPANSNFTLRLCPGLPDKLLKAMHLQVAMSDISHVDVQATPTFGHPCCLYLTPQKLMEIHVHGTTYAQSPQEDTV